MDMKLNVIHYSQNDIHLKNKTNMLKNNNSSPAKTSLGSGSASNTAYVDMGKVLLEAAKAGDADKVQECIKNGAPFITDWLGTSALHIAAKCNFYDTCATLLRSGISKDAKTKVDRTPLHFAVFEGNFEICQLLIQNECSIDQMDMLKMTPLHWAIEKGFDNIAELLLENGANPHLISKFLKTPYSLAKEKHNDFIVNLIEMLPTQDSEKATAVTKHLIKEMTSYANVKHEDPLSIIDVHQRSLKRDRVHSFDAPDSKKWKPSNPVDANNLALKLLKDQMNIQMISDAEDNMIQSALSSGRKLMLSEAGKRLLNDSNLNEFLKIPLNTTISSSPSVTGKKSVSSCSATITSRRSSDTADLLEIFRDVPSGSGSKKVKPEILNIIRSSAELQEVTITQRSKASTTPSPVISPNQKSSISLSAINVPKVQALQTPSTSKKSSTLLPSTTPDVDRKEYQQPEIMNRKFSELSNNYQQLKRSFEREQQKTEALQRQLAHLEGQFESYKRHQQEKFDSILRLLQSNRKVLINDTDGERINELEDIL